MSPAEALAVLAAGVGAGTINTIVGSGTLMTFPACSPSATRRSSPTSPTPSASSPAASAAPSATAANSRGQRDRLLRSAPPSLHRRRSPARVLLLTLPAHGVRRDRAGADRRRARPGHPAAPPQPAPSSAAAPPGTPPAPRRLAARRRHLPRQRLRRLLRRRPGRDLPLPDGHAARRHACSGSTG